MSQAESFVDKGGIILACGACMEMRQQDETKTYPPIIHGRFT